MFESAMPSTEWNQRELVAYTMNPVPINDTIVPTPNNAGHELDDLKCSLLAKAPVKPMNSMIAPSKLTPKPITKPEFISLRRAQEQTEITCAEPGKTLISGQLEWRKRWFLLDRSASLFRYPWRSKIGLITGWGRDLHLQTRHHPCDLPSLLNQPYLCVFWCIRITDRTTFFLLSLALWIMLSGYLTGRLGGTKVCE